MICTEASHEVLLLARCSCPGSACPPWLPSAKALQQNCSKTADVLLFCLEIYSLEWNEYNNLVRKLLLAGFWGPCEHRLSLYLLIKAVIQRNSRRTPQTFCACPYGPVLQLGPWRKLSAGTWAHGKNAALNKGTFSNGEQHFPHWMRLSLQPRESNCSLCQTIPLRGFWHSQNWLFVFTSRWWLLPILWETLDRGTTVKMILELRKPAFLLDAPGSMQIQNDSKLFWSGHSQHLPLPGISVISHSLNCFYFHSPWPSHLWFVNLVGTWGLQDCCLTARFAWSWPVG